MLIMSEETIDDLTQGAEAAPDEHEAESTPIIREGFETIAAKMSANEELSDEELNQVADVAIEIIRNILAYYDITDALIDEYDGDNGELIFNITGSDMGILIGYHGKVLESFKYMFSTLLNHSLGFRFPARLDIEGYEDRQAQKLQNLALSAAKRAVQRGTEVRMRPMKPYERRIVHLALRSNPDVVTHSEGTEPNRCVIIRPVRH
jgi:spoIIIJ-associated protein